jgi:hypothetical protein
MSIASSSSRGYGDHDPKPLTARQVDGLDCVLCGRQADIAVPAGHVGQHCLFRCYPCCEDER